ncbi:Uncharacterised protein [Candidatus Bilamarchaeum dharawalense]|uniref:Uncharacterized protein n=1 Tax=Candidatus Bilamarchaeum dharawalense TaxID=2885759 RepID=A0A5E4LP98_9ARCH|nr:Uncharacterised protein [Candidatus Bilamarchaeum dharawalense]
MGKGAKTDFVFIRTKNWKEIDKKMKRLKCLRSGVIRVEKTGVTILCARS